MISHISIRDFATIESVDIGVGEGFQVITGETGSGKSIIIEAVSLAFGARADRSAVRAGKAGALIQVVIDESGLPEDLRTGIELISREVSASGKNLCRVNGGIVTLAQLAQAAAGLADIHGQYDHQSLLDPENHIGVIDAFHADAIGPAAARVRSDYAAYEETRKELAALMSQEAASRRELDFVRYEVDEIEKARLRPGEYAELKERVAVMQNSEKIHAALAAAHEALSGETGAADNIANARAQMRGIAEYGALYAETERTLSDCYFELVDASEKIKSALEHTDFSRQSIDEAIARLDLIDRLIAKYGASGGNGGGGDCAGANAGPEVEAAILDYLDRARGKLDSFENIDARKAESAAKLSARAEALAVSSRELHDLRAGAAKELSSLVLAQLAELNFRDAEFSVHFDELPDSDAELAKRFGSSGVDTAEFMFTANKGLPPRPLAKVASGGEMSRVMLAIKTVTGNFDGIPTMIFDEIDTGISGVTASVVGEKLKAMSRARQIICVTHLPQIAAYADDHYLIEKSSDNSATYTTVTKTDGEARVQAIARLIGGKTVTQTTLESARELIEG
jgi:DNA repair protein RecN (Recombination protein N)